MLARYCTGQPPCTLHRWLIVSWVFIGWPALAAADIIRLKGGGELKGTVIKQTDREVVVQLEFGTMTFQPGEVEVVKESSAPPAPDAIPAEPVSPAAPPEKTPVRAPTVEEPLVEGKGTSLPDAIRAVAFVTVVTTDGQELSGTGTIINPNGVMLTNYHVVGNAKKITVVLPEERTSRYKEPRQYDASVVKSNAYYDLAIIDTAARTPQFLSFAADTAVRVGNEVKAIGNPRGLSVTVSKGIISSVRRNLDLHMAYIPIPGDYVNEREFEEITWIQTDAAINPGNSGGPLLNDKNEIIGINTWIVSGTGGSEGLGFALHVKHVRKFSRGYSKTN